MKGPKTDKIQSMFDSIADDYDKLNHILSLDLDKTWRKRALRYITDLKGEGDILDIACGTGDFSIEIAKHGSELDVTGLDLSEGMLDVMRQKLAKEGLEPRVRTMQGNAECMPFSCNSFDRVTIAFGIRNFEHREKALKEILRVLKPGGRLVILELSVPSNRFMRWCYCQYFNRILPWIGGKVSGDKAAYKYLPASVLNFPDKRTWMATMRDCGYGAVRHRAFTFGVCRLYRGEKKR